MQMDVANCLSVMNLLGDESRLRICALLTLRELSVTELVRATGISQSRVSTHLGRLREGDFVRDRRKGQHSFYAIAEGLPEIARTLLREAETDPLLRGDRARLAAHEAAESGKLPDGFAGEMERHYSPGRTWGSLTAGLAALLSLGDVLDVGSGDGAVAEYLAPNARSITCIDTSVRMASAANARLAAFSNAHCDVVDVHALPFKTASFDTVLLFHTLTYVASPAKALAECARVLRPSGRLVALSLASHEHTEVTRPYGERTPGFSSRALRALFAKAGLAVTSCDIAVRESKKPHFEVLLATATHPKKSSASKSRSSG
jgi:SAM-dependent methyltransferase/DNA-binding transcriptional ArsR family regulator